MQASAANSSLKRTVMTPFSSFCAITNTTASAVVALREDPRRQTERERSAYIVKCNVRDFTQSLAFFSHVLLQVEEQSRVVFEFLERKHALEDDDAAVFARPGRRRRSRTLIFGGPVFEFSEGGESKDSSVSSEDEANENRIENSYCRSAAARLPCLALSRLASAGSPFRVPLGPA